MSNIRLVKKDENHDNIRFGINQSYYNEVVRRLQNPNVNETVELLNSGKYLDSKTLKKHKDRLEQYKSDVEYLNEIQKLTSNDYDESSYSETSKWLEDFTKTFNERESVFSKFKNELEYNDAVKIGELHNMPSADILPHLNNPEVEAKKKSLASRQAELEKQLRELGASGNKGVGAQKKQAISKELNDIRKQIQDLDKTNGIAYTTSGGQNITWKSLYDQKKQEEDFNSLYNGLSSAEDWEESVTKAANIKNPTLEEAEGEFKIGKWRPFGEEVGNIVTYSRDNALGILSGQADRNYMIGNSDYAHMTDKEVEIYNYYLGKGDVEKADAFLSSIEPSLRKRADNQALENTVAFAQEHPVLSSIVSVPLSVGSGFEYLYDLGNYAKTGELDTNVSSDMASAIRGTVTDKYDWEVGGWDVFDFLYGSGMSMADSVASQVLFGKAGGIALGLSAAASSTNDALNRGMSKGQAFTSGVASGIFEGIFESWSIGAFSDLTKNLKRADFRNLAKYVGKNMWNNAKEEFLTEIANISYDYLANGDFSQYETAIRQYMSAGLSESEAKKKVATELGVQVAEAAGSGALMGFGFGAGGSVKAAHNIAQSGRVIKDSGQTRNLVDLGKSLGEGAEAYQYADKITDKSRGLAIGNLLGMVSDGIPNANKMDMIKAFEEKGYNTKEANLLVNKMFEQGLDSVANIQGMRSPAQDYTDVLNDPNSTVSQRNEAYEGILRGVAENRLQKAMGKAVKTKSAIAEQKTLSNGQGKSIAQEEKPVESHFESNAEGKDFDTKSGRIIESKKLVSSAKDNMAFEVTYEDGTTENVNANDISFTNEGEALVYSTVMDMNVPVGVAETLIGGYKGNDVKSAATYVNGMREAFTFGKYNQEADLNNGQYASLLTDEQRSNAFKLGQIYAKEKADADEKAIQGESKPTNIKKQEGKVHFEGDKLSLKSVQDVSLESLNVLGKALGKDFHIYESYVENGKRVYKDANGNIKKAPNGFYDQKDGSIWIDLNAGNSGQGTMLYTVAHELTHFIKQWSPTKFKALADFLVEQYGKEGVSVHQLVLAQQQKAKKNGREISYDVAFEEMVADSMETMLTDGKVIRELANKDKGLFDKIKSWIDNLLRRLTKEYKNHSPESAEGQMLLEMTETFKEAQKLFADALTDASDNFAIKGSDKAFVENYLKTNDVVYNLRAAESHQDKLAENYTSDASIDLETLQKRYAKVIGIWEKLGGELNSKFLNEWNNKVGKDRAFTIFKAQAGYKYNVELSSMCKKGVPLFEAIDTIVKKEVMNELKTKTLGKAEKEILYDILKNHNFEIPCAICYVEQARQREGVIINDFLDGKIEKNAKGKITKYKLGWNDVLNKVEKEMKKNGVDYTFRNVDKSIATDSYAPADIVMDEATQDAFYKALKKVANAEIVRWNREDRKSNQKERKQITDLKPQTIKEVFKGTLPSNLKIFKVLFNNPSSRFKISRDLLYSSATTLNLANAHNDLYSLFNSQGGVAGYKTKQAPIVYWGDILGKSWKPSTVRKEGGIRNQSNSDFQMYTLLDQAQMYIDFSAKGYYLQAYTKVLAELKLFGLSRGKINASLIPQVIEYKNADGSINWEKTMENAGLDENGNPIYDDFEGINHAEAFMLIEDAEYSKNICGICIGYSDNHIRKLLDDNRVQQIIGFHDKTDNPEKRYRGAKYSKNYNGLNEAVKIKADGTEETVHVGFNQFVSKAEKMFKFNKKTETFEGTVNHNGKEYSANDIPRLAADLYLEMCAEKNYRPAYNDFSSHKNYYKLLADFGLYDSQGNYAPHQKVQYNMPDKVPYLDKNGNKAYMSTEAYIKAELQKELTVRDSISEALADTSENGIIPQFVERVNALHSEKADTTLNSLREIVGEDGTNYGVGVYLDSQKLAILSEEKRESEVIKHIKNLGGHTFSAFDNDGNEIKIKIAPNTRYETEKGSRERANRHLTNFLANKEKQESLMLIDEIIGSATFKGKEPATKAHGWLDNNGKNEWDVWTTYIQDKENTIWEAKLKVANTTNGEKVLYDVHPIEKVGQGRTLPTIPTNEKIPQDTTESQELFSDRDQAPTFCSQMGKVVEEVKQEKLAANSVVNLLRGKGVKAEEIRWSGIVPFLESKKSVTKQELLDFINGLMLQIGEQMSSNNLDLRYNSSNHTYSLYDKEGNVINTYTYNEFMGGYVSENDDEVYTYATDIEDAVREEYGSLSSPRWADYKLDGGSNYREIVFTLPNSSYRNQMMKVHWGDEAEGVLVHARIQDFDVNGKKMLFIEEIQSDWHNEGHKDGYQEDAKLKELQELEAKANETFYAVEDYSTELTGLAGEYEAVAKTQKGRELLRAKIKAEKELKQAQAQFDSKVPDAPFKDNYHEFVLKRLIRMAAEQGYDSIGWTPAHIQSERWSDEFAEAYRIEYDQDMPKFLKKYGRQWGAKVEKTSIPKETVDGRQRILKETELENVKRDIESAKRELARHYDSYEKARIQMSIDSMEKTVATLEQELSTSLDVWSMDITDSMKESVLYEGQVLYSERDADSVSTRSLLANALEGAAQNDIEKNKLAQYKEKIALIEAEQTKLHELREKLFTKGIRGDERRKIQEEATQTANRINTYDRQLFNLESTTALKNVLNREKELARKRQKQKDNENLRAYKEKVAETTRELLKKNRESRQKAIEGRTKTEMRHKVKKVVSDLNQLLLKPTKERHIPEEMRIAVAEALALVNMDTVDADTRVARYNELIAKEKNPDVIASLTETRDRILEQGNKLGEKLAKLKDAYGMIRDSADDSLKSMYDDVIYNKIESVQKKVGKTPLRSMTLEQLESVYELYKMVLTTVRDSNKAFAENLKMTRQALGSNTFAEIKENNKSRDRIRFESIEKFGWKNLKPMQAMKTIGSGILQKLWNNILYGQEVFAQDYDEAVKFAKEMKEKYGYNKWNLDKLYSFETKSGKVMKINLEQMMSVYAYSKRKQADEHIEFGGILLNESIIKEKKHGRTVEVKVNDSTAYRLDKRQVGEIITTLEKKFPGATSFVDEMQKYLSETMGEKGNEVSMQMYGIKLFKEEHYFPLKSSKDFMEAANAKLKGDVKIKNKGMTKSTVEHANNPIVLENFLDVWGNHINEMAMYHGLVLPLEDFSRTLNYGFKADDDLNTDAESVRTALRSAFGESADDYLNELLKAINGGVLHDSSDGIANKMISKFKKAKVMASLSVIVQQPTAIIRAMGIIEPKYFVAQNFNHKATWEELKKYCPTAIIKETGSFDTNMGRTIVDMIKEDRTFTEKVGDTLGKAPAYMDEMGWNMIWRALKNKVATEQKLSGEELLKECGKQMTLIINETQVYDSVMSRNELMRSKSALTKMATSFMGEPTTVANMIYGAVLDFKRGKKGFASKTVAAVISSVVINSLVSAMVYAFRDDDEEKTWLEKYLSSATTEVLDGINPLTYIPYVKDVYSLFQGYDVERTDMAIIGDVVDAIEDFYNVLDPEAYEGMSSGEIAKHIYENAKPLIISICDMFGLPVGNILRDTEALLSKDNLPMSQTTGEGVGLAIKDGWLNSSPKIVQKFVDDEKYHKLYLVANNGNTAYVKNEVAKMVATKVESGKTEKEAKTSVRSSFTGVYRDEYKKAYKNKDAEEMNRIRKFLYATGLWNSLSELDSLLAKWRTED